MCFHISINTPAQKIKETFDAMFEAEKLFTPKDSISGFEFLKIPVITKENKKAIKLMEWGLIPSWANKDWNQAYTLNARVESIAEKPAFKQAIHQRCIIIVDAFYEWQHVYKHKLKYKIGFDNQLFALAGIYDIFENVPRFSIVTTEAQGVMESIHNTKLRMPIALHSREKQQDWLHELPVLPDYNFTTSTDEPQQLTLF